MEDHVLTMTQYPYFDARHLWRGTCSCGRWVSKGKIAYPGYVESAHRAHQRAHEEKK